MRPLAALGSWLDRNFVALGREMRLSFLPPLMVYVAAGISGLTGIVGTFCQGVPSSGGVPAAGLAGLPYVLKSGRPPGM
jgi:hypothetical protein